LNILYNSFTELGKENNIKTLHQYKDEGLTLRSSILVASADDRVRLDTSMYYMEHPEVVRRLNTLKKVCTGLPDNAVWALWYNTNDIGWEFVELGVFIPD
jgi:hypothetical protein